MKFVGGLFLAALVCGAAPADDQGDRAKLVGSWEAGQDAGGGTTWSFTRQGDSMKVTETEGTNKLADFVCATDGSTCETKVSGKKASVSMWFIGAKLVVLETKGSDVVERRFSIPSAIDDMEVEVVPIVPNGKTETLKFKRSAVASAKR